MKEVESKSVEELRHALAESEKRYKELENSIDARAKEIAKSEYQAEMMRLSSELAHDLRSPLQVITNSLFLMERKPGDTTYHPKISEAVRQASGLLDAFREYYRGHEITLTKGNVNGLIEKCLETITVPGEITISKHLDNCLPDIMLDPGKFTRVFVIILRNAFEAMSNSGKISVSSFTKEGKIVVKVQDTGAGIPEAIRGKIFLAFGVKKRGGYGLGLAAAKRIIEAHGGTISFETETGKGTIFSVKLPIR